MKIPALKRKIATFNFRHHEGAALQSSRDGSSHRGDPGVK